jgi:hypothetical protein
MGRYSKIERRMWGDGKFRKLSRPQPNARDLWIFLLTGPHQSAVPGLFVLGEASMAEALEWPLAATKRGLAEILGAGMAKFDRVTRLLWLPNALKHNPPENFNVVVGWRSEWELLPECALLTEATRAIEAGLREIRPQFAEAFDIVRGVCPPRTSSNPSGKGKGKPEPNHRPNPSVNGSPKPSGEGQPNPEPEPEPEPEPDTEPPNPLSGELELGIQDSPRPSPRDQVWAHWRKAMNSPRSVLDGKRAKRIDWALENYSLEECLRAIDGCAADPFSMGENDRGKRFNDVDVIFRDAVHVEQFRDLARTKTIAATPFVDPLAGKECVPEADARRLLEEAKQRGIEARTAAGGRTG